MSSDRVFWKRSCLFDLIIIIIRDPHIYVPQDTIFCSRSFFSILLASLYVEPSNRPPNNAPAAGAAPSDENMSIHLTKKMLRHATRRYLGKKPILMGGAGSTGGQFLFCYLLARPGLVTLCMESARQINVSGFFFFSFPDGFVIFA